MKYFLFALKHKRRESVKKFVLIRAYRMTINQNFINAMSLCIPASVIEPISILVFKKLTIGIYTSKKILFLLIAER